MSSSYDRTMTCVKYMFLSKTYSVITTTLDIEPHPNHPTQPIKSEQIKPLIFLLKKIPYNFDEPHHKLNPD